MNSPQNTWRRAARSCAAITILASIFFISTASAQDFVPTGSMHNASVSHRAVLLNDGRVLVVGGHDGQQSYATAEIYDPQTGTWRFTHGNMHYKRHWPIATVMTNGKVLVAGGVDIQQSSMAHFSAEVFDPVTETFEVVASMSGRRACAESALLNDGRVIVVGGYTGPSGCWQCTQTIVEAFDPNGGTNGQGAWVSLAPIPTGPVFHPIVKMPDGKILIPGYQDHTGVGTRHVRLYDPASNTWQTLSPLLYGRSSHTATLLPSGKVLITAGSDGYNGTHTTEVYDVNAPPNGLSTLGPDVAIGAWWHRTTALLDGKLLILGGQDRNDFRATAQLIDASTLEVSTIGDMTEPRSLPTATLLPSGKVLVAGGGTSYGVTATAELWIPPDRQAPVTSQVLIDPNPVPVLTPFTITALVDDMNLGTSVVAGAEYNIDGGPYSAMNAVDGIFNSETEATTATEQGFLTAGIRKVCVRGTDSAGNIGGESCVLLVVYDPSGGFVTGGGTVQSPMGADLEKSTTSGKVNFGFVAKYHKGANVPSGNLEFHYKTGDLVFKSTSLTWLVVTGDSRARFGGEGTVNGSVACKFEVDVWDSSFMPGATDAFGLSISSCSSGVDRYLLTPQALSGGSIIIHRK